MKKYHFVIFILTLLATGATAQQPQWLNPQPFGSDVNDIEFFDSQNGIMAGDWGAVAYSNDGGLTWQNAASFTTLSLNEIEIFGSDHALAMADTCLFETTDGGVTWSVRYQLEGHTFVTLDMITAAEGWALVEVNQSTTTRLAKTTDGGTTWTITPFQGVASNINISDIAFKDMTSGLVMGKDFDYRNVYRTFDGGLTFTYASPHFDDVPMDIHYAGNNTYFTAGGINMHKRVFKGGVVFKTTDDGETWIPLLDGTGDASGLQFYTIKTLGDSILVASGRCNEYDCPIWPVLTSTDGGATWLKNEIEPNNYRGPSPKVSALAIVTDSRLVGYERAMQLPVYTNDFENWFFNPDCFGGNCNAMTFATDNGFIASGQHILKSVDGGQHWDTCYRTTNERISHFNSLAFASAQTGLTIATAMPFNTVVVRTADAGNTWNEIDTLDLHYSYSIWYPSWNNAWIFGADADMLFDPTVKRLLYSSDAGQSWSDKLLPADTINHCVFTASQKGYLFGGAGTTASGGYYLTTDGANTWDFHPLGLPELLLGEVVNDELLFVVAASAQRSVWKVDVANNDLATEIFTADEGLIINSVNFTDVNKGYVLAFYEGLTDISYLYQTDNGGQTWQVFGPYLKLNGLTLFYNLNGFAWGDNGRLLQLANGYPVGTPTPAKAGTSLLTARAIAGTGQIEATIHTTATGQATLTLTDLTGRTLAHWPATLNGQPQTMRLPTRGLTPGMMVLSLETNGHRVACKVMVNL